MHMSRPPARLASQVLILSAFYSLGGCSLLIDVECERSRDACGRVMSSSGDEVAGEATAGAQVAGEGVAGAQVAGEGVAGAQVTGGEVAGAQVTGGEVAGEVIAGVEIAGDTPILNPPEVPYHDQACDDSTCEIEWIFMNSNDNFLVGSSSAFSDDERPERSVALQAFGISRHEVTVAQYSRCVAAGACPEPIALGAISSVEDPSLSPGETRLSRCVYFEEGAWLKPMNCITYCEALGFAAWLSTQVGVGTRLPSEAEWMYVTQGAGRTDYPWGNEAPSCDRAQLYQCEPQRPREVCTLERGLGFLAQSCDLIGNVREWVADQYRDSYEGAPTTNTPVPFSSAPVCEQGVTVSTGEAVYGVTKGGDWRSTISSARPSNRFSTSIDIRSDRIGFRVARPPGF